MKKVKLWLVLGSAIFLMGCATQLRDGVKLLEEGKYEEAISNFEVQLKENRRLDEAYRGLGIAYYELGDYEAAIESLEAALENKAKESVVLYNLLGASYLKMERYEDALKFFQEALKMDDCTQELKQEMLFNEIAIYQHLGEWDIVKEKVESYMEAYPDDTRMEKTIDFLETR